MASYYDCYIPDLDRERMFTDDYPNYVLQTISHALEILRRCYLIKGDIEEEEAYLKTLFELEDFSEWVMETFKRGVEPDPKDAKILHNRLRFALEIIGYNPFDPAQHYPDLMCVIDRLT